MVIQTGTKLVKDHLLESQLGFVKVTPTFFLDMILAKEDPIGGLGGRGGNSNPRGLSLWRGLCTI
jgi:hypothetical protein